MSRTSWLVALAVTLGSLGDLASAQEADPTSPAVRPGVAKSAADARRCG